MKKRTITAVVILLILLISSISQGMAKNFKFYFDVFNHWAVETIMWASNDVKLFNGYEDGTFRPDNNITIGEYTTLLYRAGKIQNLINDNTDQINDSQTANKILPYIDLNQEFWGYNEIITVADYINQQNRELDFTGIFPGNRLEPNKYITREEAVVLASFFTSPPLDNKESSFKDISSDYKYIKPLNDLVNNKIIEGYEDNTFRPNQYITRAEAAHILMKLYNDLNFLKDKYLEKIQLVNVPPYRRFMLFGDYENITLSNDDRLYRRAIATLEYISIIRYIPYEERHLYDLNPINTLQNLKNSGYWNVVGTNYYLINQTNEAGKLDIYIYLDMLLNYIAREDITHDESVMIFEIDYSNLENLDIVTFALDKWYDSELDPEKKMNSIFLKSKIYSDNKDYIEAIKLYDSDEYFDLEILNSESVEGQDVDQIIEEVYVENMKINFLELSDESKKCYFMNKAYLLLLNNQYYDAEKILRDGWSLMNSSDYDKAFIGAIKQVLVEIQKYEKTQNQEFENSSED